MQESSAVDIRAYHGISQTCAVLGLAIALLMLAAWVVGMPPIGPWSMQWPAMNPMVAVLIALCSVALWLQLDRNGPAPMRVAGRALGAVVALLSLSRLADFYLGTQLNLDLWLFHTKLAALAPYGHAAVPTVWCGLMLGGALMLFDMPGPGDLQWREVLTLAAALLVFQALLAYAFMLQFLIASPGWPMAIHTGISLLTIALGMMCARPEVGLMRHVSSPSPGGRLLRRLLPVLVLLPLLSALAFWISRAFSLSATLRELVFSQTVLVATAIAFAWWGGATLNREDKNRRAFELALAEREEAMQVSLSQTFDLISIFVDYRMVYINESGVRLLRARNAAHLLGTSPVQHVHPANRQLSERRLAAVRAGQRVPNAEITLVRQDGTPIEVEANVVPITFKGQPAMQFNCRDISGRKALEKALHESTLRFLTIFEGATFGILMLDTAGRVIESNRSMQQLLAQPPEAMLGLSFASLLCPDDVKTVMALIWEMVAGKQGEFLVEARLKGADGHLHWSHLAFFYIPHQPPETPSILAMVEDITERRALEARLRAQNEQLQELDRVRADVINAVTHDLRSPLTAVTGYAEMLADQLAGPLNEQQQEFVQVLQRNARRLDGMIEDMMDFVRMEAGTLELRVMPVNFSQLVENVIKTYMPAAIQASLRLEARLPDEPVIGEMDGERIERVLSNLVNNAIKFTPAGGEVVISTSLKENRIRCEVRDSGAGIEADDLPKLFQRFSQLPLGSHVSKSTGIGLYICKTLVEAHNGTIGVHSEVDKGSVFWFELPIARLKGAPELTADEVAKRKDVNDRQV